MTAMRAIIDTWNMIEKFDIQGWEQIDGCTVIVPDEEFHRMLDAAANKQYIKNLLNNSEYNHRKGYKVAC